MKINIFEGARRIALLSAGVATVSTLIAIIIYKPYTPANYSIAYPNGEFIRMEESCPSNADNHYFTSTTSTRKEVSINLCLLPMPFGESREQLIPYKVDEMGVIWGAASYSSEVSDYEEKLEKRFKIPVRDEDAILKEISSSYLENMISSLGYLVAGLAIFGAIVWAVGWIVRGFLGIPRGMDKRSDA